MELSSVAPLCNTLGQRKQIGYLNCFISDVTYANTLLMKTSQPFLNPVSGSGTLGNKVLG